MKYLKIKNKGIIEPEAFMLIGASTKRNDDTKIGQFGSGNKYAIAYFLRNEYEFKVFSDGEEIKFSTTVSRFGGNDFNVVNINNQPTSITTEMGYKWKLWQAIREIYSNAKDEGLLEFVVVDEIKPSDNTEIFISLSNELYDFLQEQENYFVEDRSRVLFECSEGRILKKTSNKLNIYRKGIRCYDTSMQSIFDYDFENISINESRIVEYSWQIIEKIWKMLLSCDNSYVIRKVLEELSNSDFYESNISNYHTVKSENISDTWKEVLKDKQIAPKNMSGYLSNEDRIKTYLLPSEIYTILVSVIGEDVKSKAFKESPKGAYKVGSPTTLMLIMLEDVLKFFDECNFEINYPIDIVNFKDNNIHGSIAEEKILLSEMAFSKGKEWVANVIIEEYIHLKHQVADETRSFQDAAISELLTYMKTINSYNL